MATQVSQSAPSSKKWDQVLSRVQGMLKETLATADRRLEELDKMAKSADTQANLTRHLQGLEDRLSAAGLLVAETDRSLAEGEQAVRDYLKGAEGLRQRLADWAARNKNDKVTG